MNTTGDTGRSVVLVGAEAVRAGGLRFRVRPWAGLILVGPASTEDAPLHGLHVEGLVCAASVKEVSSPASKFKQLLYIHA